LYCVEAENIERVVAEYGPCNFFDISCFKKNKIKLFDFII